jgi:UDP-N-acetylmuramoyl-tripeptide--D-alanyl-D-alanine ligase
MKLTVKEISKLFPSFHGHASETVAINEVFTDSRQNTNKGLFIPIVGDRFDGHEFLEDAISQGAIAALWQSDIEVPRYVPTDFPLFFVEDTIKALQELSKYYRKKVNPVVVGITGSNGKTTTKDLVDQVLCKTFKTHKTRGNYNNHIGLPLTILSMPTDTEVLILEMGMNHFGEISVLSEIAQPHYAIITNIGESHIEFLGSREGIAKAKMEITDGLRENGKLIIDGDEPLLQNKYNRLQTVTCGFNESNNFQLSFVITTEQGIQFTINGRTDAYQLPMLGFHNAKNATLAIALAKELKVSESTIDEQLKSIEITGMRLQRFEGMNRSLLINDAYNASPTSMAAAIETIKGFGQYDRKIVVLGNMYELGPEEETMHRTIANVITAPVTDLVTIGEKAKWIGEEVAAKGEGINIQICNDKAEAETMIKEMLSSKSVVIFKASRKAKFETLVEQLRDK